MKWIRAYETEIVVALAVFYFFAVISLCPR